MFGRKVSIRNGFYMEMDDISTERKGDRLCLCQNAEEMHVSEFLQLLRDKDSFLPVYLDRNTLAGNPVSRLQSRIIFQGKQEKIPNQLKKPVRPDIQGPGTFEREQMERDIRAIKDTLERELRDIDRQQDFMERFANGGFFTDEEQMYMGRMDGNAYADSRNFREYLKQEKIEKANRAISQRRYAVEQQERRAREAQERYETLVAAYERQERRQNQITLMRCGMAVYQKNKLVSLLVLREKHPVWHLYGPDGISLTDLSGTIYEVEVLGEKKPDEKPLLEYMEKAYGELLPSDFDFRNVREKL